MSVEMGNEWVPRLSYGILVSIDGCCEGKQHEKETIDEFGKDL